MIPNIHLKSPSTIQLAISIDRSMLLIIWIRLRFITCLLMDYFNIYSNAKFGKLWKDNFASTSSSVPIWYIIYWPEFPTKPLSVTTSEETLQLICGNDWPAKIDKTWKHSLVQCLSILHMQTHQHCGEPNLPSIPQKAIFVLSSMALVSKSQPHQNSIQCS